MNGAASPESVQAPYVSEDVLNQLSRQLEYYFSTVILSRDTYLRTLRELNDGCVPATIIANFAKVQLIFPHDSYFAVISNPPLVGVQNTIILREVKEGVTEDDIRELFDFEKCPSIQQVVEDMSSFW